MTRLAGACPLDGRVRPLFEKRFLTTKNSLSIWAALDWSAGVWSMVTTVVAAAVGVVRTAWIGALHDRSLLDEGNGGRKEDARGGNE
jgi:hypothetical protein